MACNPAIRDFTVVRSCLQDSYFAPKAVVVTQGGPADCMYIIRSGQACVLVDPNFAASSGVPASTDPNRCVQARFSPRVESFAVFGA